MRLRVDYEGVTAMLSEPQSLLAVNIAEVKLNGGIVDSSIAVDDGTELSWQLQKWRVVFAAIGIVANVRLPGSSYIVSHAGCSLNERRYVQNGSVTFQSLAVMVWKRGFAQGHTYKSEETSLVTRARPTSKRTSRMQTALVACEDANLSLNRSADSRE